MYWLWKLKIIDKSPVWLSKAEEFSNCSWQSYCMAVTNHWQFSCMALSLKKSLTILLFGFQKSLTIFLYGFELVNNHWQTSCMAVTNHWQMSIMALSQKVDKITGNSWQNYCNSLYCVRLHKVYCKEGTFSDQKVSRGKYFLLNIRIFT